MSWPGGFNIKSRGVVMVVIHNDGNRNSNSSPEVDSNIKAMLHRVMLAAIALGTIIEVVIAAEARL